MATMALQVTMKSIESGDWRLTAIVCGTGLGFYLVNWFILYSQFYVNSRISQHVSKKIRSELFIKLNKLPIGYFDKNPAGDIMSRFINDVNNV